MKLGRKIKKIKRIILNILKKYLPIKFYNILVYQLAKPKFNKAIYSKKIVLKKSTNLDSINNYEYKITSQNNEDGIIEYLTNNISNPDQFFIEIGFDFNEFNTLNLIQKKWNGTLIDGDHLKCDKLNMCLKRKFFNQDLNVVNSFVDYENINYIINNITDKKNFDFFSLDTDGMDYWILKEINIKPKIICLEFNTWLGKNASLAIPQIKNFNYKSDMYYGASLKAFKNLLNTKGYKLVAIESSGNNAFFIRQDEFQIEFKELNIDTSFKYDPKFSGKTYDEMFQTLINKKWIKI